LHQAIESIPELAELKKNLLVEQTPEGLRIQLIDEKGYSMFALGSSKPNEQTRNLVQLVTRVVDQLPNKISISGHTDAVPYRSQEGYTN
jgi:chemotaxis protein MotB